MAIVRAEITRVALTATAGRVTRPMETLLLRLLDADGAEGWGEAFGHSANATTATALASLVGPWLIGRDGSDISGIARAAARAFHGYGAAGPVRFALSAVDMALWDMAGRRGGQPVWALLGGSDAPLGCYASLLPQGGDVAAVRAEAQAAEARGFTAIKLHETTLAAFRAARAALPADIAVMLDVNCAWDAEGAREIALAIRDDGFAWLEEPVFPPDDWVALAELRRTGMPIAAGENAASLADFRAVLQAGSVDVLQPSVAKIGGITAMRQVFALAEPFAVRVVPHCFYYGPGFLATAHLIAAMPRPPLLEVAFAALDRPLHPGFDPSRPRFAPGKAVGLGFDPDPQVLRTRTIHQEVVTR